MTELKNENKIVFNQVKNLQNNLMALKDKHTFAIK